MRDTGDRVLKIERRRHDITNIGTQHVASECGVTHFHSKEPVQDWNKEPIRKCDREYFVRPNAPSTDPVHHLATDTIQRVHRSTVKSILSPVNFSILELLVVVGIIGLVSVRYKSTKTFAFIPVRITSLIPVPGIEWYSGYRRWGLQLLLFYLLSIGLSFLPFASLFLLSFLTFVISGFYTHGESLAILNAGNLGASAFLKQKILRHSKFTGLFLLPVLIIYVLQHPEHWYIALIAWFVYMINIFYFITLKYALYRPDKKLTADSIWVALLFASTLIPFLFPIPIIVALRNYSLSKINLKIYLDDHS